MKIRPPEALSRRRQTKRELPMVGQVPSTLFIEITTECNLRCRQCHMWLTREEPGTLSTDDKLDLIAQFAQINMNGGVVFTGGEPFRKLDQLFALCGSCRRHGLLSVVNTNATYIAESQIPGVFRTGPDVVVISLDSHRAELHDYVRGIPGTFTHVVGVVRAMAAYRKAHNPGSNNRLYLSAILFDSNISLCVEYLDFARELGVDGVTFQMLDRTFRLHSGRDTFFERHWFTDAAEARRWIDVLIRDYGSDPFLLLNERDLEWMKIYVDSPDVLPHAICGSYERNLMVDMHGNVQLCAYMRELLNGESLGNVRHSRLRELWTSARAVHARTVMETCTRPCGMLNCHRKRSE